VSTWRRFEEASPELASFGRDRLDDRVAYLATGRPNGWPRVHPVSVRIREGRLFVRMDPASPKARDLLRDGRYAMHSQVLDTSGRGGEFAISGTARLVDDSAAVEKLERGLPDPGRYVVFEFDIEQASSTVYEGGQAVRRKWGGPSVTAPGSPQAPLMLPGGCDTVRLLDAPPNPGTGTPPNA